MNSLSVMTGFPPKPECRITPENWEDNAFARWGQFHTRCLFPTARVFRGYGPISEFEYASRAIHTVKFINPEGQKVTVEQMLQETETDGFLVIHQGRIIFEAYFHGMCPETQHIAQSVSKSMLGMLAGILWEKGLLDLDAPVTDYVPDLKVSEGYCGSTIRQNLDMTAGVQFSEDPADCNSEWNKLASAAGIGRKIPGVPDTMYDFLLTLQRARPHGEAFEYASANCEVIAWIIQRATGRYLPDLFSEWIWSPLGAEQDAYFALDRVGMPITHGLFNAVLRDYGRFGQMILQNGFFNGKQIIPPAWVSACRQGDSSLFARSRYAGFFRRESAYSRFWWVVDVPRQIFTALGFRGQFIYIDPQVDLVIVKLSSLASREVEVNHWAYLYAVLGFQAIADFLAAGG